MSNQFVILVTKMDPVVSVIIPNYNHAPFLRERIESVLAQQYQGFEVIILDDYSTDDSQSIISSYADNPHISHIVISDKNSGSPFSQWNKGISLAKGAYIWIAESDDVADPQMLGTLMDELQKRDDAVIAFAHSRLIDEEGAELPYGWHKDNMHKPIVYEGRQFVMRKMLTSNYIYNASMAVFRKSAYKGMNTNFQNYSYCGDWAFWIEMALKGKVIEVGTILNSYRLHQGQTTNKSVQTGGKWIEMGNVLQYATELLHLTDMQRRCLRGRYTKRFIHESLPNREEVLKSYASIFGGSQFDIYSYEIGKFFNFLKA